MGSVNLYLKGINLAELLQRFRDGELSKITQLRGSNLTCSVVQLRKHGDTYNDPTFVAKDGNGYDIISYNAGHGLSSLGSFLPAIPPGRACRNCPRKSPHHSIGFILEIQPLEEPDKFNLISYKNFCTFECHLRGLINEGKKNQLDKDPLLVRAHENLHWIYDRQYPGTTLKASPEPDLHEGYDGPMKDEEFHANEHVYIPTNNIFISPCSRQYIQS